MFADFRQKLYYDFLVAQGLSEEVNVNSSRGVLSRTQIETQIEKDDDPLKIAKEFNEGLDHRALLTSRLKTGSMATYH